MTNELKKCPFLGVRGARCQKEECGLWNSSQNKCALVIISDGLGIIHGKLVDIEKTLHLEQKLK